MSEQLKNKVYVMGDIHFSGFYPWSVPIGNLFLRWFQQLQVEPGCTLVQLGDPTEYAVNSGTVFNLFMQFCDIACSKFDKVIFIPGNHEQLYRKGVVQQLEEYPASSNSKVHIAQPFERLTIGQDIQTLSLPYVKGVAASSCESWYNKMIPEQVKPDEKFDLIFGHLTIKGSVPQIAGGVDVSLLPPGKLVFGHIHTAPTEDYVPSVIPNKTSEVCKRYLKVFTKTSDGKLEEQRIDIPEFVVWDTVKYPAGASEPDNATVVHLLQVIGTCSLDTAREFYNTHYVYNVRNPMYAEKQKAKKNAQEVMADETFKPMTMLDAYNNMKQDKQITVSPQADQILESLLAQNVTAAEASA